MPRFTIPGIPVAQPRQRHRVVGMYVQNYTPTQHPVNTFKAAAQLAAQPHCPQPFDGPVVLSVIFVLPRPKGKMWKTRPMPRELHVSRPDVDNLLKSLKDALKGIAWRDDAQVWSIHAMKQVAAGDEAPHTEVEIME
jgi:Holliday junction resolvase RusA-like endonuclease